MKTLREEWTHFFSENITALSGNYPGISLKRFLMEAQDILIKRTKNPLLKLEDALFEVSRQSSTKLQQAFLHGVPFAYMTRHAEFYGREFYVSEHVLVPRSETELMVDLLAQGPRKFRRVLDVGTGSGVILLSLLRLGTALEGLGVDISEKALETAKINARRHRLQDRARFLQGDRLAHVHEKFDLIVSNPPYIKAETHRSLVHKGVEAHEPHLALFLADHEYGPWFRAFFHSVSSHLEEGGLFMMEGHELELDSQAAMLADYGFKDVQVLSDYAGLPRFLRASL